MNKIILRPVCAIAALSFGIATATADTYSIDSFTVDGGGGFTSGGIYSLNGTAGQPDAGFLAGGSFKLAGGFWGSSPLSFAVWVAGFGLSGPNAAPGADPDGDRLTNAAEYVLGGDPTKPNASLGPAATLTGGTLFFTFSRSDTSETQDVSLALELGTDLATWPVVYNVGPDTAASTAGVTVTENGAAPDLITVAVPAGLSQRLFARLRITVAP